ncbi:hypothetical protein EB796_002298 [Bugula neritina]|uniref:Uncharacterized protein n=1 Tax=Bugula neritina TaxID=10212 RepID=A0A7J7KMK3_BUGNE|nr:hypothetical protein EB796_002298 [Bugula neritina]
MKTIEAKAVVLGAQAVGKTSVVMRCVRNMFDKAVGTTIGAAFFNYRLNVDGYQVHLQIWDTAGQERFKSMAPMYYRKASIAILVYDITDLESFKGLKKWVMELIQNVDRPISMVLFGNKCDLTEKREVSSELARDYAESVGAELVEMSALTSQGVNEGFEKVCEMLISNLDNTHAHVYDGYGNREDSTRKRTVSVVGSPDSDNSDDRRCGC